MLTLDKIYHASHVLKNVVRETKLVEAPKINPECEVYLKPECLQLTGSFKLRGSGYMISQLSDEEKAHGVIACSAGNHAQGVALAATKYGIKSLICLPDGAPISKVEATKNYGAEVCMVKGVYDDAYAKAIELRDKCGYTFVHPFDDINVIAGQGTIGLEIMEEMSDVDAIVVPIGGGGLISGVAFAAKKLNPKIKVYGVQAAVHHQCTTQLKKVKSLSLILLIQLLTVSRLWNGENTFKLVSEYVDEIVTVTEDEISSAILALIEQQKMIAEGAGAVSVAAVMFNKLPVKGKKVVCVVSGGNIDVTILSRVIKRGLMNTGRSASLCIELMDKPGQLEMVSKIIADCGGNVISVHHERASEIADINGCYLRLVLETKNFDHIAMIEKALKDNGFKLV